MKYNISRNGRNVGKYTLDELKSYYGKGILLATDWAWQEGMPEWVSLESILQPLLVQGSALHTKIAPPPETVTVGKQIEDNYVGPKNALTAFLGDKSQRPTGIRRLPFFGICIALQLISIVPQGSTGESWGVFTISMVLFLGSVWSRLKNIGMTPWLCLLMFVPIANILILIRCLAFQEGYQTTKKLDTAGKVVSIIALICISAPVLFFLFSYITKNR